MLSERERLHNLFPDLDFDPEVLREKYRDERDRRIRADAEAQYLEAEGELAHFSDEDPYVPPGYERSPLDLSLDAVVIGAGFSGLMTGARLKERGIHNFRIIEAAGSFGGTWYWNRYPGAQCDIESYCYLPLLEETGYMPKEKYSYAPEIYDHVHRVAEYFELENRAIFQTRVTEVRWLEEESCWQVSTEHKDNIRAQFVIQATGPANRPKLPKIPGISDFQGRASTPPDGTMGTREETTQEVLPSSPTNASLSLARVRLRFNACPFSANMPRSCMFFSERLRRWICAATNPPTRRGIRNLVPVGKDSDGRTLLPPCSVRILAKTWLPMVGQTLHEGSVFRSRVGNQTWETSTWRKSNFVPRSPTFRK